MEARICTGCAKEKPIDQFYHNPAIKPDGIRKRCNECRRKNRPPKNEKEKKSKKEWESNNRDRINRKAREYRARERKRFKGYSLQKDFGITLEDYEKMVAQQNGLCKLCKKPETTKHQSGNTKDLAVDHDHVTGAIRGLLCWVCNTGIGKLQDDPILLRAAADYIEEHRNKKDLKYVVSSRQQYKYKRSK